MAAPCKVKVCVDWTPSGKRLREIAAALGDLRDLVPDWQNSEAAEIADRIHELLSAELVIRRGQKTGR